LNKKLALISLGVLGSCLQFGAMITNILDSTIDTKLLYVIAVEGAVVFALSCFISVCGAGLGWFDKKEAKA